MLARTNKGDLGAERRADLDENDLSSTSVDLFCEKHDYIFVKYLHEDKYEIFKFKLNRMYSFGSDELLLRVVMEKPYYTPAASRTSESG